MLGFIPAAADDTTGVMFDFTEVEIRSFIKVVSELTGENFVIDPSVTGKITVTSPSPIPGDAIPSVFRTVLDVYGFAAVPDGNIVKIIPVARAKQESTGITTGPPGPSGLIETRIHRLDLIDGMELKGLLQPLLGRAGHIAVHPATNMVIITDENRNLERIGKIIQALDRAGPECALEIIALTHAPAADISDTLTGLFSKTRSAGGARPVFIGDNRSNNILINAPVSMIEDIRQIISRLDIPLPQTRASIRVIHLNNTEARSIASILNAQLTQAGDTSDLPDAGKPEGSGDGRIYIGAEPLTNSLIVTASPEDHPLIEEVVRMLDIARRQILVEALVVEMSTGMTRDLGLEWRLTNRIEEDEYRIIGGTNLPAEGAEGDLQQTSMNPYRFPSGLVVGLVKGTISFGGVEIANIGALARAMEGASGVNILSTPHLLTLDNEEAEIIVGEERPFLKSSQITDTGAVVKTYEFKDVGLTLKITPRIVENDQIMLKLFQEIKNFVAESDVGAVTSSKRQARTSIRVQNKQIAVIGGLLKEDSIERESKVPCLGNLPGIGYLFKATRRNRTKSNLLIFITPHIIDDSETLQEITSRYRNGLNVPEPEFDPDESPEDARR
ncbi:type II secretion system secretin GspD [bacterium]|nr:type II secretion system secretin GspD [candidate division CSSED10-310 bacterium]